LIEDFLVKTHLQNLSLLKAGPFDKEYKEYCKNVTSFNWVQLYDDCPLLIPLFADKLAQKYRYVLIDSRTGFSDTSSICTMLMPQKLVVVFTPTRQSYTGIELTDNQLLIRRVTKYRRRNAEDMRPLLVYPLPSRIEFSVEELLTQWRRRKNIPGYQPLFQDIFKEVYGLKECSLEEYFDEVQIQQSPSYVYGEQIAAIEEKTKDRFSLLDSYIIFTNWLVNSIAPWQRTESKVEFSLLNTLVGPSSSVNSVAISSDNSKIVSGSWDKTIKVWELNTGRLLNTLEVSSPVTSVAISSDNSKIASGSWDKTIKVWELNTGRLLNTFEGRSFGVTSVAISSDNSKIASTSSDNTIKVWDLHTGRLLNTFEGHSFGVTSVAISSDNSKI
jgi:hypothetical protein